MVIQRTVDKLRERPEHERAAVASTLAIAVVVILFLGWAVVFVHGLGGGSQSAAVAQTQIAASSSASSVVAPTSSLPALEWQTSANITASTTPLATSTGSQ